MMYIKKYRNVFKNFPLNEKYGRYEWITVRTTLRIYLPKYNSGRHSSVQSLCITVSSLDNQNDKCLNSKGESIINAI